MKTVRLGGHGGPEVSAGGSEGLEVSAQGLGCAGMSEYYGRADWDTCTATIRHALDLGVTLLDTSDVYGSGHNEVLVGRAIAGRRADVAVATKFGIDRSEGDDRRRRRGSRGYVRRGCEASLLRLGIDTIDLYYLHRVPEDVPLEETVGHMAELVDEGKVRHLGLSEVDADQLRRAHRVHPITAVQSEYSLWTRDVEALATALAELEVGLVPYAPLGRGFLTATFDPARMGPQDLRRELPRFEAAALQANKVIVDRVREVATRRGVTAAQVALAWVSAQAGRLGASGVVPIPGTTRAERVSENVAALDVDLDAADLAELDALGSLVTGARYAGARDPRTQTRYGYRA